LAKLTPVYSKYLYQRNKKICRLRKQGKFLKELAYEFDLSIRQINRIIHKACKKR